jgi:hypothetical protein
MNYLSQIRKHREPTMATNSSTENSPIKNINSPIKKTNSTTDLDRRSFSESEGQGWCSEEPRLDDPRPLEPKMRIVGLEAGWGFFARAEMLNGRLAMLGFVSGVLVEALSGQGILAQIGLGSLLPHH